MTLSSKLALFLVILGVTTTFATQFTFTNYCSDTITVSASPPFGDSESEFATWTLDSHSSTTVDNNPLWTTGTIFAGGSVCTAAVFFLDVYDGYDVYGLNDNTGFNYAMQIKPSDGCLEITCSSESDCGPYPVSTPYDNKKSPVCANGASYDVVFCP